MVGRSINCGPWADVGMAASGNLTEQHNSLGMGALKNDDGIEALSVLTEQNTTQVTAAWIHWNRLKELYPIGKANLFSQMEDSFIDIKTNNEQNEEFFYKFIIMKEDERHHYVASNAQSIVSKILGYDNDKVNVVEDLNDLGMDSIAATQIQAMVSNRFGINISIFDLFNGSTIEKLSLKITFPVKLTSPALYQ